MSIDVEVPLLDDITKRDLVVDIQTRNLRVELSTGQTLLSGPLHGSVMTTECGWVIVEADPTSRTRIRGRKLVVSLEKTHASREIWTTLFDRGFIKEQQESTFE